MNSSNHVWKKLSESSDLTRDLLTIYNKDFFVELIDYFDKEVDPLDLVETTLDTARAYIIGWNSKQANKSNFNIHTGRHVLKAGVAARDLEHSLRQITKSGLAEYVLNWNMENIAKGKSPKTDQLFDHIQRQFGPSNPLEIYRIIADSLACAVDGLISLPDKDETEREYIARGDAFSAQVRSDKWCKVSKVPAHHALQKAAITFQPLWEQHSSRLYHKGRYDESKGGFYSPPAKALHFVIRKIAPEVKLTLVGTAIGKPHLQS